MIVKAPRDNVPVLQRETYQKAFELVSQNENPSLEEWTDSVNLFVTFRDLPSYYFETCPSLERYKDILLKQAKNLKVAGADLAVLTEGENKILGDILVK